MNTLYKKETLGVLCGIAGCKRAALMHGFCSGHNPRCTRFDTDSPDTEVVTIYISSTWVQKHGPVPGVRVTIEPLD